MLGETVAAVAVAVVTPAEAGGIATVEVGAELPPPHAQASSAPRRASPANLCARPPSLCKRIVASVRAVSAGVPFRVKETVDNKDLANRNFYRPPFVMHD